jgi:hypothetical protein
MLPKLYQQHYQNLWEELQELQQLAGDFASPSLDAVFSKVQKTFQTLLNWDLEGVDEARIARIQSYQPEMAKHLRLLATDLVFLRSARQATTLEQRRQQIRDRIGTLMRYCDGVLKQGEE